MVSSQGTSPCLGKEVYGRTLHVIPQQEQEALWLRKDDVALSLEESLSMRSKVDIHLCLSLEQHNHKATYALHVSDGSSTAARADLGLEATSTFVRARGLMMLRGTVFNSSGQLSTRQYPTMQAWSGQFRLHTRECDPVTELPLGVDGRKVAVETEPVAKHPCSSTAPLRTPAAEALMFREEGEELAADVRELQAQQWQISKDRAQVVSQLQHMQQQQQPSCRPWPRHYWIAF